MRVVTAAEMRDIERRAIAEYEITEREMMEAAANALIRALANELTPESIAVVCGPGNNGGDGLAVARILSEFGQEPQVLLAVPPGSLKGEPLAQYRRTVESGVKVSSVGEDEYEKTIAGTHEFDTVIDCLLGTGATGAPRGEVARLIDWVNQVPAFVMSADVPSGIDCDTGRAEGTHIEAMATVTFGLPKPFLFQGDGIDACGQWTIGDIGLPPALTATAGRARLLDREWFFDAAPGRLKSAHKRSAGVVLVIAGSEMFPGAAVLTARGAYRAGAGLVIVAGVGFALEAVRAHLPECPLVRLPESGGSIDLAGAEVALAEAARCDAVCVGPGLGRAAGVKDFLATVLPALDVPVVVDADALYFLAEGVSAPSTPVLTPHEGEAARLLGKTVEDVSADRFSSARKLAEKFAATVLLKGPYSLVAHRKDLSVNPTGDQLLATGGTGDVLTGVVGAVLAMGVEPHSAAAIGAYWHGLSARSLRESFPGGMGALASEIADNLSAARAAEFDVLVNEMMGEDDWEEEDEGLDEFDEEDLDENDN